MSLLPQTMLCDIDNDPGYGPLKQHIIDATGLAYYLDKDAELAVHIGRRLAALSINSCHAYRNQLIDSEAGAVELDALTANLTIGETFFFRHHECFDALRDRVLPELIERNRSCRRLRIWSAGCAIGAEPYSLAILLRHHFALPLANWDVSIVGTDINREFLAQAERGEFSDWTLRAMSDELKTACFVRRRQGWMIKDEYRRDTAFQYHNLVQHPSPSLLNGLSAFDLILCRNVMIYFDAVVVRRLVGQFHDCLAVGGWFVVGPTEPSVGLFQAFETVNSSGAILYRSRETPAARERVAESPAANVSTRQPSAVALAKSVPRSAAGHWHKPAAPAHHSKAQSPALAPRATLTEIRARLNQGQSAAAEESCQTLLRSERLNPAVHFYHALVAGQQGRYAECEQSLRRAIYLNRDFVLAHYHLGLVLHRNRDARAAERSLRNVLQLLDRRDSDETLADADGLTVGELRQLARMQLEVLDPT
ncbi:MAG TPA: CheR family methyltransferase [Pirellulales bacterium]|jgi:chemotaxis protein methyltransferase CheR|nr:CheR family methyltransferase [Pirellulales bacterium]